MASDKELSDFLKSVEKRAFKRVVYGVRDPDAALDIVQDAMIRLAEHYADRPAAELPPLFQRILTNATMDWFRRNKSRGGMFKTFTELSGTDGEGETDVLESLESQADPSDAASPANVLSNAQTLHILEAELAVLPARQREAFLLRYWEELDIAETAEAMNCSAGSVKTHCFRAVQSLAKALRKRGIEP